MHKIQLVKLHCHDPSLVFSYRVQHSWIWFSLIPDVRLLVCLLTILKPKSSISEILSYSQFSGTAFQGILDAE